MKMPLPVTTLVDFVPGLLYARTRSIIHWLLALGLSPVAFNPPYRLSCSETFSIFIALSDEFLPWMAILIPSRQGLVAQRDEDRERLAARQPVRRVEGDRR